MTKREENKEYNSELLRILKEEGIIIDEETVQIEQYLWNSMMKGVN